MRFMRSSRAAKRAMPPDSASSGAAVHHRALESLYRSAPINRAFPSTLEIVENGFARIRFEVTTDHYHAAGALHGTAYFKMLDDAAFYAVNSLVSDRFVLTTRPIKAGPIIAEGRWISGQRRVFVADARLIDANGEEAARGTGTFMRSGIALSSLLGYASA